MKRRRLHLAWIAAMMALVMALAGCGRKPAEAVSSAASSGGDPATAQKVKESAEQSAIREALAAEGTATVELPGEMVFAAPLEVSGEKTITGGTITVESNTDSILTVPQGASLILDGAVLNGNGKAKVGVTVEEGATFVFASGSIEGTTKQAIRTEGAVTIADGSFTNSGLNWVYLADGSEVTINGGTFDASGDVGLNALSGSKLTINGGIFSNAGSATLFNRGEVKVTGGQIVNSGNYAVSNEGKAEISNLVISGSADRGDVYNFADGVLTMTDCALQGSAGYSFYNNGKAALTNVTMSTSAKSAINNQTGDADLTLTNCVISDAGSNGIYNKDAALTIQDVQIKNSGNHAIYNRAGHITAVNLVMENAVGTVLCNDSLADDQLVYGSMSVDGFTLSGAVEKGITCYGGTMNLKNGTVEICGDQSIYIKDGVADLTSVTVKGSANRTDTAIAIGLTDFENAVVTMTDVNVSGGARGISNHGTLTLNSGVVTGNKNNGDDLNYGGGVYNFNTFTMNGGTIFGNTAVKGGAGIMNAGTAYLNAGTITGNASEASGGGIYNGTEGVAYLNGIVVENNTTANEKGGAGIYNLGTMTISGATTVKNNKSAGAGAGIMNSTSDSSGAVGKLTIENVTVSGNEAVGSGGAVFSSGVLTIKGGTFIQNTAGDGKYGGGVYSSGDLNITGGSFTNNTTGGSGGGIYITGTNSHIENALVEGNRAGRNGGGISCSDPLTVGASTVVRNNTAGISGGGIYCDSTAVITDATVENNTAGDKGGGIYNYGTMTISGSTTVSGNTAAGTGGGIMNSTSEDGTKIGDLTIENATVSGNESVGSGGGVFSSGVLDIQDGLFTQNKTGADKYGGGVYSGGDVTITGGTYSYNECAAGGGGIYITGTNSHIENALVEGNTSQENGAGISCSDPVIIVNTVIRGNTAVNNGGGLYLTNQAAVTGCSIVDNTAGKNGANVYVASNCVLNAKDCEISGGTATGKGGGMYIYRGRAVMDNAVVTNNTSEGNGVGVYNSSGTLEIIGGSYTRGENGSEGYIVHSYQDSSEVTPVYKLSGQVKIDSIYLAKDVSLQLADALKDGSDIAIRLNSTSRIGNRAIVTGSEENVKDAAQYLSILNTSKDYTYVVKENGKGDVIRIGGSSGGSTSGGGGGGGGGGAGGSGSAVTSGTVAVLRDGKEVYSGTLPDAISNARAGDVLELRSDVSADGKVTVNKDLTIQSDGAHTIFLQSANYTGMEITANVTIAGTASGRITITRSTGESAYQGINVKEGAALTMEYVNVTGLTNSAVNKGTSGGILVGGSLTARYCSITDCHVTGKDENGGALYVSSSGMLLLNECELSNCTSAKYGGAIYCLGTAELLNTTVKNCRAESSGAAVYVTSSGKLTVTEGEIINNTATTGSGAVYIYRGAATLNDVNVAYNINANETETKNGTGVYNAGGALTISGGTYENAQGRTQYVVHNYKPDKVDTTFILSGDPRMESLYLAAGVTAQLDSALGGESRINLRLGGCETGRIVLTGDAEAIAASNEYFDILNRDDEYGIGYAINDEGVLVETTEAQLVRNGEMVLKGGFAKMIELAEAGDTIVLMNDAEYTGGEILEIAKNLTITDDGTVRTVYLNRTVGVSVSVEKEAEVTIAGTGTGGITLTRSEDKIGKYQAMTVKGTLNLQNVTVTGLVCDGSGSGNSYGGAIYVSGGTLNVTDSAITDCQTTGSELNGGAIYIGGSGTLNVDSARISGNKAAGYGGAIYNYNGTVTLSNVTAENNSAVKNGGALYVGGKAVAACVADSTFADNATDGVGADIWSNLKVALGGEVSAEDVYFASAGQFELAAALGGNTSIGVQVNSTTDRTVLTGDAAAIAASCDKFTILNGSGEYSPYALDEEGKVTSYAAVVVHANGDENTYCKSLTSAKNAAADGDKIVLLDDVALSAANGFEADVTITDDGTPRTICLDNTAGVSMTIKGEVTIEGTESGGITLTRSEEAAAALPVKQAITISENGTLNLKKVTVTGLVSNGTDSVYGGAIYVGKKAALNVTDSVISNCRTDGEEKSGGAIYITTDGLLNMANTELTGNSAKQHGGAIYNYKGTVTLENVTAANNTAGKDGGAICVGKDAEMHTIIGGTFTNNTADGNGDDICAKRNIAIQGAASIGELYLAEDCSAELTGELENASIAVTVDATDDRTVLTEEADAGYIASFHDTFTVLNEGGWYVSYTGKIIERPEARLVRGGATVSEGTLAEMVEAAAEGDAVVLLKDANTEGLTMTNKVTITDDGTARAINLNNTEDVTLVVDEGTEVTIEGTENGGVILTRTEKSSAKQAVTVKGTLNLKNVTVTGLESTDTREVYGGAIYVSTGMLNAENSKFTDNSAGNNGGAIYVGSSGILNMTNSEITGNTAAGSGGGMYIYQGGKAVLTNVTVTNNTGNGNGDGIYNASGTLTINGGSYTRGEKGGEGYVVHSYQTKNGDPAVFQLSGAAQIESIYLAKSVVIELTDALADNAAIGVRVNSTKERTALTGETVAADHDKFTVLNVNETTGMTYLIDETGTVAEDPEVELTSGGTTVKGSLAVLLEQAVEGDTITLLKDIALDEDVEIAANVTITDNGEARTLDLNGNELEVSAADAKIIGSAEGSLTITDKTTDARGITVDGKFTLSGDVFVTGIHKSSGDGGAFHVESTGELILGGGVYVTDCSTADGKGTAICNEGTLTIENNEDKSLVITAQDEATSAETCAVYNTGTVQLGGDIYIHTLYTGTIVLTSDLEGTEVGLWLDDDTSNGTAIVDLRDFEMDNDIFVVLNPEDGEIDSNGNLALPMPEVQVLMTAAGSETAQEPEVTREPEIAQEPAAAQETETTEAA